MQNRYAGDVHDYRKYGLLRMLEASGFSKICVVWKLTWHDEKADGNKRKYLDNPSKWQIYDPGLFHLMNELKKKREEYLKCSSEIGICRDARLISWIEQHRILKEAIFLDYSLKEIESQHKYDLVFFDPDNGIEVKSKGKGRLHADKYVCWDEIKYAWNQGASVLIYQHFPRVKREPYIKMLAHRFSMETDGAEVKAFRTHSVVFLLAIKNDKNMNLDVLSRGLKNWGGEIWDDFTQARTQETEVSE